MLNRKEYNTIKKLLSSFKKVVFLFKYFWEYGKLLFLLSFLGLFYGPIQSFISIKSIQYVVDNITSSIPFKDIISRVIIYFSILIILNIYIEIIDNYFWEKLMLRINAGIRMEIFKHVVATDYKYFDNPNFYNDYSWAASNLNNLSVQSMRIVRTFLSRLFTITTLIALTASMDSFLILFAVISLLIGLIIDNIVNRISYKKSEALIPINGRQEYIDRLFYLKDYAEEIRTTKISNIYFEKYKENVKTSYSIIDKWRTKLTALNSISKCSRDFIYGNVYDLFNLSNCCIKQSVNRKILCFSYSISST